MAIYNLGPWETVRLPVLDIKYPEDATIRIGESATFSVKIAEEGRPDEYTYQWYVNGKAVEGATETSYTRTAPAVGTESVYCVVANKAGSVQSRTANLYCGQEFIVTNGAFVDGDSWGSYCYDPDSRVTQETWGLYMIGDGHGSSRAWSNRDYDCTGKNKLVFYCPQITSMAPDNVGTFFFGVADDTEDGFVAYTEVVAGNYGAKYVVVDVSQISGRHRIKICLIRNCAYQDSVWVQDIYFE